MKKALQEAEMLLKREVPVGAVSLLRIDHFPGAQFNRSLNDVTAHAEIGRGP